MKVKIKVVQCCGETEGKVLLLSDVVLLFQRTPQNDTAFHLDLTDFGGMYFLCCMKASDPIPGEPILYSYNKLDGNTGALTCKIVVTC